MSDQMIEHNHTKSNNGSRKRKQNPNRGRMGGCGVLAAETH